MVPSPSLNVSYQRRVATGAAFAALILLSSTLTAQWRNLPTDGVPMKNGKPDMAAPAPRLADGKIDLSGIWQSDMKYFRNLASDIGLQNVPMTAEARKIQESRASGDLGYTEPDAHCLPQGVPKINSAPVPFKIVQTPKLVVLVYEAFNLWRQVHMDDRQWETDLNPTWLGYSKGRWEGDDLVVETRGINGKQWLDHGGLPTSDKLVVVERFKRPSYGRLEIELLITDPTYYTKPWTVTTNARRLVDTELLEFICPENERSTKHMGPNIK